MPKAVKTEHAGAKNGGGMWTKRAVAKELSNTHRRRDDRVEVGTALVEKAEQDEAEQYPDCCGDCGDAAKEGV